VENSIESDTLTYFRDHSHDVMKYQLFGYLSLLQEFFLDI